MVAPASPVEREALVAGCAALERMGYQPVFGDDIFDQELYFAGSVERRARELMGMFMRADVKAVVCARGGYGANYLLPLLDLEVLRKNPKIFVGYSDVTSLLTWLRDAIGLVVFHGPMVAKDFAHAGGVDFSTWFAAVAGGEEWLVDSHGEPGLRALRPGTVEGVLYGGCLSMLAASLGTPYEVRTDGSILLIEDVNAKPFQVDRMLMQLKMAGKLRHVRGMVFGVMQGCVQDAQQDYRLEEIAMRVLGDLEIPIAYGLRTGHVEGANITVPLGVRARLSAGERVELRTLEAPSLQV